MTITTKLQLLNVQHNFCSVVCYLVRIWILIILTLANNILSHPVNWHKPVCCIRSDKINLHQTTFAFEFDKFWKLKIHIRRMRIFDSLVTSLFHVSFWNLGLEILVLTVNHFCFAQFIQESIILLDTKCQIWICDYTV